MALKNPTPPTPPTPPVIDKGDGANNHAVIDAKQLLGIRKENSDEISDSGDEYIDEEEVIETPPTPAVNRQVTTPETMAREAVANGGGALTKRTTEKPAEETPKPAPGINFAITEDDRGKAALREFQAEDKNNSKQESSITETPKIVKIGQHESYGGFYWVVTIIFSIVAAIFFVKKFLLTDKPKLKKSDLYTSTTEKNSKPVAKLPQKKSDEPTKHFEVRV